MFHQLALMCLVSIGLVKANVYAMRGVPPFGVPQVISSAFWGGIWGVLFAPFSARVRRGAGDWIAALAFGAICPTLVAWFVVSPLKGLPVAAGWQPSRMIVGPIVNGAWGIGTGVFLALTARRG